MKTAVFVSLLVGVLTPCLRGEYTPPLVVGQAPEADALFAPLQGDPRELHLSMGLALPDKEKTVAEVAIGHYYGIYRWALPNDAGYTQLNIGGGIFPRFNFADNKHLQVVDFYASLPFDIRMGRWSGRFMFYHVSSHLGDDYIRDNPGLVTDKNSWNSLRSTLSCDVDRFLRLYGGYTYHLMAYPATQQHQAAQGGLEIHFKPFVQDRAQIYWANDAQWWERTAWKTQFNSQLGVKIGKDAANGRSISYYVEYTDGPEYYGQFFTAQETRIGLGIKFEIS